MRREKFYVQGYIHDKRNTPFYFKSKERIKLTRDVSSYELDSNAEGCTYMCMCSAYVFVVYMYIFCMCCVCAVCMCILRVVYVLCICVVSMYV